MFTMSGLSHPVINRKNEVAPFTSNSEQQAPEGMRSSHLEYVEGIPY